MRYWTLGELRTKIEQELDLQGEVFIEQDEMTGYINDAIDAAESQIHTLYEDYFLTLDTITLVSGTSQYNLPEDIYASKIRKIVYRNGAEVYVIKRLRDRNKILNYSLDRATNSVSPYYEYFLINQTPGEQKILFTPAVNESGAYVEVWHIRNANQLVAESDKCDIPEFARFVMQYVKVRCYDKEGHPHLPVAQAELDTLLQDMVSTLAGMVVDDDNEIEADYSPYDEMS
jgi:hypothetical protein